MISNDQREFIDSCVFEHDGDVWRTATAFGIPPITIRAWLDDALFDAELQRTQYIRLRSMGFDRFSLAIKLMSAVNANIADVANIESITELAELPTSVSYAIQSFKRSFDPQLGDVTIEIKQVDKLKALLQALKDIAPALQDDARNLGGQDDARLTGISLELPYEVLEERGLLPPPTQEAPSLDEEMDDWLNDNG